MADNYQDIFSMADNHILTYNWSVLYAGKIWVYSNVVNALFAIDPQTGSSQFVCWSQGPASGMHLAGIYKEYLVSIARTGEFLQIVDTKTYGSRYITLKIDHIPDNEYIPILIGKQLILCPTTLEQIVLCDIDTLLSGCGNDTVSKCLQKSSIGRHNKIAKVFRIDNYIVGAYEKRNELWIWHMKQRAGHTIILEQDGLEIADIKAVDTHVYILYTIGKLVVYNLKEKSRLWSLNITESVNGEIYYAYEKMMFLENAIWFFPALGSEIVILDMKSREINVFNQYPPDFHFQFSEIHQKYLAFSEDDTHIFVGQRSADYMLVIDKLTGNGNWVQIKYPENFYKKIWKEKVLSDAQAHNSVIEEWKLSLADYLDAVNKRKNGISFKQNEKCGREIFNIVCRDGGTV